MIMTQPDGHANGLMFVQASLWLLYPAIRNCKFQHRLSGLCCCVFEAVPRLIRILVLVLQVGRSTVWPGHVESEVLHA
jgi:hypothetical protein